MKLICSIILNAEIALHLNIIYIKSHFKQVHLYRLFFFVSAMSCIHLQFQKKKN